MTKQSTVFGAGSSGDYFPSIGQPAIFPPVVSNASHAPSNGNLLPWGHLANGDYFVIPILAGNPLQYFNAAGSQVYSKVVGTIGPSTNVWIGFTFIGDKMYALARNSITDAVALASIDVAGTVVQIGNDVPIPNMAPGQDWNTAVGSQPGTHVIPDINGTDLIILTVDTAGSLIRKIQLSDGQVSLEETDLQLNTSAQYLRGNLFISNNGTYFGQSQANTLMFGSSTLVGAARNLAAKIQVMNSVTTETVGSRMDSGFKPIYYNNSSQGFDLIYYIDPLSAGTSNMINGYDRQELSDWADKMNVINYGSSIS